MPRGGPRPGSGRKKGSKNVLPRGQVKAIKTLVKIFKQYGYEDNMQDPVAFLKEKGMDSPLGLACMEELTKLAFADAMPRNAATKAAILMNMLDALGLMAPKKLQVEATLDELVRKSFEHENRS